jgi:trehalose 2-sulfotransferase
MTMTPAWGRGGRTRTADDTRRRRGEPIDRTPLGEHDRDPSVHEGLQSADEIRSGPLGYGRQIVRVPVPKLSYLVASTQRSGSTLLCRSLADAGVAGRPEEYFLTGPPEAFPPGWTSWEDGIFARPHGPMDREGYLDLVFRLGTTPNGVFGAKLMWNNVPHVLEKLWELPRFVGLDRAATFLALFPNLHVIHLTRRDRVAQAVSWARAAQDGVWVLSDTEPAAPVTEPVYSYEFIAGLERLLIDGEHGWRELCAELGEEPLDIVYEDLVDPATYADTIRSALDHLSADHPDLTIGAPRTHRQADEINEGWIERYTADRAKASHPTKWPAS